ncbi:MAG: purple acid phosphatase family protein, partial [Planctomycetota bacterium]
MSGGRLIRTSPFQSGWLLRVVALVWLLCATACMRGRWPDDTPALVYLTWQGDPTTTMTVQWLSAEGVTGDEVAFGRAGEPRLRTVTGQHEPLTETDRVVHTVELTGLEPGGDYRFRISGLAEEYAFRTMPADAGAPVAFVVGGDIHRRSALDERIFRTAASRDPMFAVLGGDIAYDNGHAHRVGRWYELLDVWQRCMVTADGRLVPVVAAIGNHEAKGSYGQAPDAAPRFYDLFPGLGRDGRQVLDFGEYMSVILLDTDHTHRIDGEQTRWLAGTLAARSDVPHLFVVYHVPAYPSVRRFNGGGGPGIREHWVPLFDRYGVDVVFEHHDHAYKRTHLIRGDDVHPDGVLYLGDGAWGAKPRRVRRPRNTWYLARAESVNNVIVT